MDIGSQGIDFEAYCAVSYVTCGGLRKLIRTQAGRWVKQVMIMDGG